MEIVFTLVFVNSQSHPHNHCNSRFAYVTRTPRFTVRRHILRTRPYNLLRRAQPPTLRSSTGLGEKALELGQCLKTSGAKPSPFFTRISALEEPKDSSSTPQWDFKTVATGSLSLQATATPDTASTRPEMVSENIIDL